MVSIKLKTAEVGGNLVSIGQAKVFYSTKEEAGVAMEKLYYERELGDDINIEYFKMKEGRLIEQDRLNDHLK